MKLCMYVYMNEYVSVHVRKSRLLTVFVGLDRPGRWNSASWSPLHTMWTRMAKKNRFLSSVQHNPLAHHREGEEEEEEGVVVARGFWNLLCIIIMLHSIVSAEKVRSALYEHGARRRQAATQYPHPPNDGMPWHHTKQL